MGNDTFRDWIPAGADPGAQGNVFQDFVPPAVPTPKEEIKTQDEVFQCAVCNKQFSTKLALSGHSRSHKK